MPELLKPVSPDKLDHVDDWLLPDMGGSDTVPGKTTFSKQLKNKKNNKQIAEKNEVIEDIIDDEPQTSLTAQELEKITNDAKKEGFDAGHKEGYEKGTAKGIEEGKEKGLADGAKEIQETVERLQVVIDTLLIPIESEKKQLQDRLCKIICALTTAITQKTLDDDSSMVVDCVDEALSHLEKSKDKVILHLSEKDHEIIQAHLNNTDWNIHYQTDESLIPGGCRVETEVSDIDFSIESQLTQVLQQFSQEGEK